MNRRPGVTLIEVLAAIFIMAIGTLAILTLFPLGALTMGQALKDDRCINCVQCANGIANAFDLRHDPGANNAMMVDANGNPLNVPIAAAYSGPSSPVYVDPYYATSGSLVGIARIMPTTTAQGGNWPVGVPLAQQFFSLLDDITFAPNGAPAANPIDRGGVYTWAYMLQMPNVLIPDQVDMAVVVYRGRPTTVPQLESSFLYSSTINPPSLAGNTVGSNSIIITYNPQIKPPIRRGGWMLENTPYPYKYPGGTVNIQNAAFYRVVNVVDNPAANQMTLELQTPLTSPISGFAPSQMVFLPSVQEVFDRSVYR